MPVILLHFFKIIANELRILNKCYCRKNKYLPNLSVIFLSALESYKAQLWYHYKANSDLHYLNLIRDFNYKLANMTINAECRVSFSRAE